MNHYDLSLFELFSSSKNYFMIKPLLSSPLLGNRMITFFCIIALVVYFQFYEEKNTLSNFIIIALFTTSTILSKYILTNFFGDKIIIKKLLKEQAIDYNELEVLQVIGYKNSINFRIILKLKNGKSYSYSNDNFWTEDLCNLMHHKGIKIELLKKAKNKIAFDEKKEVFSVRSKQTRNNDELVRKKILLNHSFFS